MFLLVVLMFVLLASTDIIKAATYSKKVSTNTTINTAVYKTSKTANYYTSGATRWSFNGHSALYVSGTTGKGVTASSPKTTSHSYTNGIQSITRCTQLSMVDYNYNSYSANSYRTWKFNTTTNRFV